MASDTLRCEPPEKHRHLRFHWLLDFGDAPIFAEWHAPSSRTREWWFAGRARKYSPDEVAANGYTYFAPAIPPEPKGESDG